MDYTKKCPYPNPSPAWLLWQQAANKYESLIKLRKELEGTTARISELEKEFAEYDSAVNVFSKASGLN